MTVTLHHRHDDIKHVNVDMTTTLGSLVVPDPVFTASGCAAAGQELAAFNDLTAIGGVVTKSIQLTPRAGRATPRMAETPSGMLNSIGLQGPGIDVFIKRDLSWLDEQGVTAVVSIAGGTIEDYAKVAGKLRGKPMALLEVNISCPNVEDRGQVFACNASAAASVVQAVRRSAPAGVPVFAKLSPDVTDVVAIAKACVDAGAAGLTLINTTLGMVIDTKTMRPILAGVTGGLSGPAIRPLALRCVWQVHEALPDVPIFGVGGIRTGLDALEFILAGASAVQVGTVIFNDPGAPSRISRELREALAARGMDRLEQAIGLAHRPPEEIIPELPDPPGDELESVVIAERAASVAASATTDPEPEPEPEPVADAFDTAEIEAVRLDDADDAPPRRASRADDVPFDIEALDDFGDQDA